MKKLFLVLLMLPGCAWMLGLPQVGPSELAKIVEAISQSHAAGCFWFGGRGGGGGLAVAPGPIPGGGYGSGEILFGRVNRPNTKLNIENGKCTIDSGPDAPSELTLSALRN